MLSHDNGLSFSVTSIGEPIVGLAQAADGTVIAVGPSGPLQISIAKISAGV